MPPISGLNKNQLFYLLYSRFWVGVDWLLPPTCGGCGKLGWRWCPDCQKSAQPINFPTCPVCSIFETNGMKCSTCRTNPPPFQGLRSWGGYSGVLRSAVHRMKYQRDIGLSEWMSRYLVITYQKSNWSVDMVVPVPLGRARQAERGYNQVNLIGFPFAWACNLPYQPKAITRIRDTLSQVGLDAKQRKTNVEKAFTAEAAMVNHKTILLIDDVATTCSTLISASQALVDAGAEKVYCLTLARTTRNPDEETSNSEPD